jgi:hypothetical protein
MKKAITVLEDNNRNGPKLIILMTDGDVNENAINISKKFRNSKDNYVICIGIGIEANKKCEEFSTSNSAFFINNYEDLHSIFSYINTNFSDPPSLTIRSRGSKKASFECSMTVDFNGFELEIFDEDEGKWKFRGESESSTLKLKDNVLKPETVYKARCRAKMKGSKSKYSKELTFRTISGNF